MWSYFLGRLSKIAMIALILMAVVAMLNGVAMGHGFKGLTQQQYWQVVGALAMLLAAIGWVVDLEVEGLRDQVSRCRKW